jgi:hypothetical protein
VFFRLHCMCVCCLCVWQGVSLAQARREEGHLLDEMYLFEVLIKVSASCCWRHGFPHRDGCPLLHQGHARGPGGSDGDDEAYSLNFPRMLG